MVEIILGLIIAGLFGGLVYERREHSRQTKELIKDHSAQVKDLTSKMMAKNLNEYVFTESKKPLTFDQMSKENAAKEDDLVDIDELSEDELSEAASKTADKMRKAKK